MPQQNAPARTPRRLPTEPVTPYPQTTQIRVCTDNGRGIILRPLADILSPRTRATLAALKGGRTNGR